MNNVNKPLYIPLYGKAFVSQKGIILHDPKAEEIWRAEGFPLKGKARSKWLAYYMGMRSAVFDQWVQEQLALNPTAAVLHIGCGMDSRVLRVGTGEHHWYDIDFPEVIQERKRYYQEEPGYQMLSADVRTDGWIAQIPRHQTAIVVMEGVSMYMQLEELCRLLQTIQTHFDHVSLLMDCYTVFAAKATKYKNPINEVGVTNVYGIDNPMVLTDQTGLAFVKQHEMTPGHLIDELTGLERTVFRNLYAGKTAEKLYRMYEYQTAK